jgi:PadR family transcriptional regulator, regulatory protein AphA
MSFNQTAYLILGMLSIESNKSGYDIRKAVESSVSYFWRESYGQIYPTLKRLAAEGLIIARQSNSKGRPERREYSLSAKGRACLQDWLAAPYRDDPPRNEFLLKLFFGRSAPPNACVKQVRNFQDKNKSLLSALLGIERWAQANGTGNPHLTHWLLTLTFGIAQVRASIEWSDSALATLESANSATTAGAKRQRKRM